MIEKLSHPVAGSISLSLSICCVILLSTYLSYLLFLHPLSHIPGPLSRRVSSIPLWVSCLLGTEGREALAIHAEYGPIVLLGPNDVHINDGSAIAPIYIHKGGFQKAPCYSNSDIDGIPSMFSTTDHAQRTARAKGLLSLFSTSMLRSDRGQVIHDCAKDLVEALRKAIVVADGGEVDLMDLTRRFSLDAMSGYLFGKRYGAFKNYNGRNTLSVSPFIDNTVDLVRFFILPNWLSGVVVSVMSKVWATKEITRSYKEVDDYLQALIDEAARGGGGDTYQKRLLDAGISREEAIVQCKDSFFGGTDLTATTLGVMLWNLVKHPECISDLRKELLHSSVLYPPLLHATLQEGLRTSLASPVRFPRIVPASGWTYSAPASQETKSFRLPRGASVGVSAITLHMDESIFLDAHQFQPQRWLDNSTRTSTKDMQRNSFAFGAGLRQCIARNLANEEMLIALRKVVESEVLNGMKVVCPEMQMYEWFNARIRGAGIKIRRNLYRSIVCEQ